MSLEGLRRAIDALDEHSACEGIAIARERLAVMLPDGDVAAVDDPRFVDWLVEHGEPAPFGHNGETRIDAAVRDAIRLRARGAATVAGFDPAEILDEIAAVLSPQRQLDATLTDIVVYPAGGHFARHKDTPRSADLLGTLVVGLPIAHTGGVFRLDDREVDWSEPAAPNVLRWVAMFSDADHEITRVESGARVTLVYALTVSDRERIVAEDPRLAAVRAHARDLELPEGGPLMIACARHVIALDEPQPQPTDTLRGVDRDIADALASCGFDVKVRTCIVARVADWDPDRGGLQPPPQRFDVNNEVHFARLATPFPDHEVERLLACVTFETPWGDGGGYWDDEATNLAPYLVDQVPLDRWIFRRAAAATFLRTIDFADDGFVGNGAVESFLYKLAALEVTR